MRILIVDDNSVFRIFLSRIVEAAGDDVTCAASGAEALALFEGLEPDVVFTDINMPGMGGMDLLAALRERNSRCLPIIAITSEWRVGALSDYLAAGFDWAIEKPLNPAEVLNILTALRARSTSTATAA